MLNQALYSSKNMCWCTPQDLYDQLDDEFHFVLDAAATSKSAKCNMYYTPEDDGLSQTWNRGGVSFVIRPTVAISRTGSPKLIMKVYEIQKSQSCC